MVEGPGATRNHWKTQAHLKRLVLHLQFGKIKSHCEIGNGEKEDIRKEEEPWWFNTILSESIVIGKEVFLLLKKIDLGIGGGTTTSTTTRCSSTNKNNSNEMAIRLHFGMNGSVKVTKLSNGELPTSNSNTSGTTSRRSNIGPPPTFQMMLGPELTEEHHQQGRNHHHHQEPLETIPCILIESFQSTVSGPMPISVPKRKHTNLSSCDVCSEAFQPHHVLDKINLRMVTQQDPNRIISDVLLDQYVFPGVGNIIKIEALHGAKLHPKAMISSLSQEQLTLVIAKCRTYARRWLKEYRAPSKMVYNQSICGSCQQSSICIQKVGQTNRTTFWCIHCQPYPQKPNPSALSLHLVVLGDDDTSSSSQASSFVSQLNSNQKRDTPMTAPRQRSGVCPDHGPSGLVLKRVRNGKNTSRIFSTCTFSKCNYFSWADTHFPMCSCRSRTVLRISKTDRTGGRWFFSCRNKKVGGGKWQGSECGHFEWANKLQLERLGSALHPLL